MTNGLIGKKLGMTQVYGDGNALIPVTVIEAGPCRVVQVKTKDRDGYEAVQLSYGEVKERKVSRAASGHLKASQSPASRILREFKRTGDVALGQVVDLEQRCVPRAGRGVPLDATRRPRHEARTTREDPGSVQRTRGRGAARVELDQLAVIVPFMSGWTWQMNG